LQWSTQLEVDDHYLEGTPHILPQTNSFYISPGSK